MGYPNSIARGQVVPLSPPKPAPKPRPQPTPDRPRRKPGRPTPERPRRPPAPAPRPAPSPPSPAAPPGPVRPNPRLPGRFPDRTPALPYGKPYVPIKKTPVPLRKLPHFPKVRIPGGGWLGVLGAALPYFWPGDEPDANFQVHGSVVEVSRCDHHSHPGFPWESTGYQFAVGNFSDGGFPGNACIQEQAGYGPGSPVAQTPDYWEFNNSCLTYDGMFLATYYNPQTNAHRGWHLRSYQRIGNCVSPGGGVRVDGDGDSPPVRYAPAPAPGPWQAPFVPWVTKPDAVPEWHAPQPVKNPAKRPEPVTPEMPDVGPRPDPNADPGGWPGMPDSWPQPQPQPVPEGLPEIIPEIDWKPNPVPGELTWTNGQPSANNSPQARQRPRRPPPKGTKEMKVRMHPMLGFLWNNISPVTEAIDFIEVMYECLPKNLKRQEYWKRGPQWNKDRFKGGEATFNAAANRFDRVKRGGRQPNPLEKMELIYQHINKIDAGCVVTNYIKEQLEDMLYALGGKETAKASRKDNRPIGYTAGGGLGGWRPHI